MSQKLQFGITIYEHVNWELLVIYVEELWHFEEMVQLDSPLYLHNVVLSVGD